MRVQCLEEGLRNSVQVQGRQSVGCRREQSKCGRRRGGRRAALDAQPVCCAVSQALAGIGYRGGEKAPPPPYYLVSYPAQSQGLTVVSQDCSHVSAVDCVHQGLHLRLNPAKKEGLRDALSGFGREQSRAGRRVFCQAMKLWGSHRFEGMDQAGSTRVFPVQSEKDNNSH